MKIIHAAVLLTLMVFTICGCTPSAPQWPTLQVAVDEAVQTQMADIPAPTRPQPTIAPSSTPYPIQTLPISTLQKPISPGLLSGLVFRNGYLMQVQPDGTAVMLTDKLAEVLSPDQKYALANSNGDFWLINLLDSKLTRLTMTENRVECCAVWWTGHTDKILFLSNGLGGNNGVATNGYLSVIKQDGTGYRVLDPDHPSSGVPAVSPDGTWIAYGHGDSAWLFGGELGPQKIDPAEYGLDNLKGQTISYPAWSPDGRYLAWSWHSELNSGRKAAVLILDMQQKTHRMGSPFTSSGVDPDLAFKWSPDGSWLAYMKDSTNPGESGAYLIRMDSPLLQEIQISSIAGLIPGAWHPDSKQLVLLGTQPPATFEFWLLDVSDGSLSRVGLEQYQAALILSWN